MTKFTIYSINSETKKIHELIYNNEKSYLFDLTEGIQYPTEGLVKKAETNPRNYNNVAFPISKNNPVKKSKNFQILKISFGLKCNYSCEYCSQRFVPETEEDKDFDVDNFLNKIYDAFDFGETGKGKKIEYWGGEPLIYWNKIVPIAENLKEKFPDLAMSIITNGSLMTKDKADWIDKMNICIGMSHDGPGQSVRGPNPFDVPKIKENILHLYDLLRPKRMMSFNAMLNNRNTSRAKIQEYFIDVTKDENVQIGEGDFIDAYDMSGYGMSLEKEQFKEYSLNAFKEIRQGLCVNFVQVRRKIVQFLQTIQYGKSYKTISQKCGMEKEYNITVDLNGDVLTCQNVSSVATAPNGESHKIGNIDDFDNIKLTTATHWSHREKCSTCPVLHLCQGSCMFLEGLLWEASCNNAYYDNIPFFCSVIEHMTGCIPIYIDGDLPEERKDIFGLFEDGKFSEENFNKEMFLEHIEKPFIDR
jgi:uncharacterized protein